MFGRLLTLVVKELQLVLRDRQSRQLLIVPVLLQVILFPNAQSLEVRNATLAILNSDGGAESTELVQRLSRAQAFPHLLPVRSESELANVISEQRALLALEIPADFSRQLAAGRTATLGAIIDGRRSNSAQIALGYAEEIVQDYAGERAARAGRAVPSRVVVRNWFNPNLEYQWFILPALVAIIATLGSLIVTALSVAREREQGTFDQLLVSPLTPGIIMTGKTIPALIVAMVQATIVAVAARFLYGVPFQGSVLLLYLSMLGYGLSLAGFGLFISSLCETQQQAFLGVFSFMVPAVMLSGFIAPVENMPLVFRVLSWIDPLSHFIVIVKGLFLKGYGIRLVWRSLWPLLLTALVTLSIAYWMFRRRIA
jgi:ABC-2 type transport system permease protein